MKPAFPIKSQVQDKEEMHCMAFVCTTRVVASVCRRSILVAKEHFGHEMPGSRSRVSRCSMVKCCLFG